MSDKQVYFIITSIILFVVLCLIYLSEHNNKKIEDTNNNVIYMETYIKKISNELEIIKQDIENHKSKLSIIQNETDYKKKQNEKFNEILSKLKTLNNNSVEQPQ